MKADTEEDCLKYAYIISKTYNRLLLVHSKDTFYQLQQNHYKFFFNFRFSQTSQNAQHH